MGPRIAPAVEESMELHGIKPMCPMPDTVAGEHEVGAEVKRGQQPVTVVYASNCGGSKGVTKRVQNGSTVPCGRWKWETWSTMGKGG